MFLQRLIDPFVPFLSRFSRSPSTAEDSGAFGHLMMQRILELCEKEVEFFAPELELDQRGQMGIKGVKGKFFHAVDSPFLPFSPFFPFYSPSSHFVYPL